MSALSLPPADSVAAVPPAAPTGVTWPADRAAPLLPAEARPALGFEVPRAITARLAALAGEREVLATLTAALHALLHRVASPWENAGAHEVVGAGTAGSWRPVRQCVAPDGAFAELVRQVASGLRAATAGGAEAARECRAAVLLGPDPGERPALDLVLTLDPGDGYRGVLRYDGRRYARGTAERIAGSYLELLRAAVEDGGTPVGLLPLVAPRSDASREAEDAAAGDGPWDVTVAELFDRAAARHPDAPALRWDDGELTYAALQAAAERWAAHIGAARTVALTGPRCPELFVALMAILKSGAGYVPIDPAYPRERRDYMLADSGAEVLVRAGDADAAFTVPDGVRVIDLDDALAAPPGGAAPAAPRAGATDLCYVIYTSGSTGLPKGVGMPHRPLCSLLDWQFRRSAAGPGWTTLQFAAFSFDVAFQEVFATWGAGGTLLLVADEVRRDPDRLVACLADRAVHRLFLPFVALQQLAEAALRTGRVPTALREVVTAGEQLIVSPAVREFFRRTGATLENQYGPSETHVVTAERLAADPAGWPELPAIGRPIDRVRVDILDERLQALPDGVPGEICVSGLALADGYVGKPGMTAERFVDRVLAADGEGGGPATVRTYRTGDYGVRLPDGRLQCLGRRDGQVKIRGFRVELGEVEACVKARDGLAEAVVVVQEAQAEKRLVAYYLLAEGHDVPPRPLRAELARILPAHLTPFACVPVTRLPLTPSGKVDRRGLAERPLPEDVDAAYEAVLDELGRYDEAEPDPYGPAVGAGSADTYPDSSDGAHLAVDGGTPTGAPAHLLTPGETPEGPAHPGAPGGAANPSASATGPANAVEPPAPFGELLAGVWADALARDTIGVHADLFALGAESATALEVAAQLGDIFRLTVPVRVLFDRRTVADQAAWLAAHDAANGGRLSGVARLLLAHDSPGPARP